MTAVSDTPSSPILSDNIWLISDDERRDVLHILCQDIVNSFVSLDPGPKSTVSTIEDGVFSYACQLLSLGLLYREFSDSIKEGDGHRVLRCWRYLLLVFKASGRRNNLNVCTSWSIVCPQTLPPPSEGAGTQTMCHPLVNQPTLHSYLPLP